MSELVDVHLQPSILIKWMDDEEEREEIRKREKRPPFMKELKNFLAGCDLPANQNKSYR
jgi:hypothetical protein